MRTLTGQSVVSAFAFTLALGSAGCLGDEDCTLTATCPPPEREAGREADTRVEGGRPSGDARAESSATIQEGSVAWSEGGDGGAGVQPAGESGPGGGNVAGDARVAVPEASFPPPDARPAGDDARASGSDAPVDVGVRADVAVRTDASVVQDAAVEATRVIEASAPPVGCEASGTCAVPCGARGQSCCAGSAACAANLACTGGVCACGGAAQPCCGGAGGMCSASGTFCAASGTCTTCGGVGQPCCGGVGGTCGGAGIFCAASGTCTTCGGAGQACCGGVGGTCSAAATFCGTSGTCTSCGGAGQACCGGAGGTCSAAATVCASSTCTSCGGLRQPCCANSACSAIGTTCSAGTCGCRPEVTGTNCDVPRFEWIDGPGATDLTIMGVSADGSVVVGAAAGSAFRWTRADGVVSLGPGFASSVSGNGLIVVGSVDAGGSQAVRWPSASSVPERLSAAETFSSASSASYDGAFVVGDIDGVDGQRHAFRWTRTELRDLGALSRGSPSYARGISRDGSVVVGDSDNRPFRWKETLGMVAIAGLQGVSQGSAGAVSADGKTIVGYTNGGSGFYLPWRWQENGQENGNLLALGSLQQDSESWATDVSENGSVVLGQGNNSGVWMWDAARGMRTLANVLAAAGITTLNGAMVGTAVLSDDGAVVAGRSGGRGFIARLP